MEGFLRETIISTLSDKSIVTLLLIFGGGLVTSISPCILSMLPVMVGYIGGSNTGTSKLKGFALSSIFVLGMSSTFALMGLIAASFGLVFGQIGSVWYYVLAAVSIIMGLHIVGVIHFNIPGLKHMPLSLSGRWGAYLMGALFGLVASPCATPVLAVIMTYVATQGDLSYGTFLLFVYGIGHGLPLILVGTFTSLLKKLPQLQRYAQYVKYFSGMILILLGLYLLSIVSW